MLEEYYNIENFPTKIATDALWDIYKNASGYCAAIPIDKNSGRLPTHYGDLNHVTKMAAAGHVTLV